MKFSALLLLLGPAICGIAGHRAVSCEPRGDGWKFLIAKFCVKSQISALRKHLKSPTTK